MNVAIIPARAGSKSIHNKNLQRLGNKTLVDHAVDLAKAFPFDDVILSTDIEALYTYDRVRVVRRPESLATDSASMEDTVSHVIEKCGIPDHAYFWLLQPTAPFRTREDVFAIKRILDTKSPSSVVSVAPVGSMHPERMYRIRDYKLWPFSGKYTNFKNKQELNQDIFIRNGCFYVVKVEAFKAEQATRLVKNPQVFAPSPAYPYVMESYVNIDSEQELVTARYLYETLSHSTI